MATYTIIAVHLEQAPGSTHEHIASVRLLGDAQDYARSQIIAWIYQGHIFFTQATQPARVYVHACPHCAADDYITTHADATTTNNLLDLPHY